MSDTNQPTYQEDEITLKELILKIQEYVREIWRYKWWVVAAGIIFAGIFLLRAVREEPTYTATLTFMVNEDEGGGMGGIATILGQFGLSSGSRAGKYNMDKIVALARSRRIQQQVLFEKTNLNGQEDFIANHLISIYNYQQKWEKDTLLQGFFFQDDQFFSFDQRERQVMLGLYGHIVGNPEMGVKGLLMANYNKDTGILSLNVTSESEILSIAIAEQLYKKLSRFYIEKSTEQQQKTYFNLGSKVDSISRTLQLKEQELAQYQDRNQSLLLRADNLKLPRLKREVQMLTIMYGEVIKNLETASFLLGNATPVFQMIDQPISPVQPMKSSKIKAIIIGGFLGGFLALVLLMGRKMVKDALTS